MSSLVADRIDPIDLMPVSRHARRTRNLLAILTGAIIAFLYIPIVFLVLFSFETSNTPGLPITGLTTHWYEAMLKDRQIQQAVLNSVISPAIVAGALLSVTLSIDEFVITFFTVGPQQTLPLYIYTSIKLGVTPEVNAVATVILVVTLGVFALGSLLLRGGRHLRQRETG